MKPLVLCILDGVGIKDEIKGNAVKQANMPTFNRLMNEYPHTLLEASGQYVGLPEGQMGNSEVGHTNIGAGRIVYQPLELINKSIKDGDFFDNKELKIAIKHAKDNNSKLHLLGLLSDGGIHSRIEHLFALLDMCKKENFNNVYIHVFTDGRDTLTDSSPRYLKMLEDKIKETGIGTIATISGRFYAMDRDNRWDRIEKAYNVIVNAKGEKYNTPIEAIENNYKNGITDEFIIPSVIDDNGIIEDNDAIIVYNYRPDRLRELLSAISNKEFHNFFTKRFNNIKLVTMMLVSDEVVCTNAFKHQKLNNTLGEYLSKMNFTQLRIAETEKYAHVTYFFDGGVDKEIPGCDRILVPSPKVATYDLKPEMSCEAITDKLINAINTNKYDVVILNYANGDMLGHTGVIPAAITSLETLDKCLTRLCETVEKQNGLLIITADHGNCEFMLDDNDNVITSHTTSQVPFIVTSKNIRLKNKVGKLADIAPTILKIMNLEIPQEMTGDVLIEE